MHHYETLARRVVDEVETAIAKVPVRWVAVQQIARRLRIHHSSAIAAVRVAVDRGWLIAEGSPPHSICRQRGRREAPFPCRPHSRSAGTIDFLEVPRESGARPNPATRARTERMLQAKLIPKSLLIPLVTLCGCTVVNSAPPPEQVRPRAGQAASRRA